MIVTRAVSRFARMTVFVLWFAGQVVVASLEVAWDAITPRSRLSPGIVAHDLRSRTALEVSIFMALVNLTPGTLTIALRDGPRTLYVHGMYVGEATDFREELRSVEGRFLDAWRSDGDNR